LAEGVSEEKIKMWKVNGRQTTDDKRQVMAKAKKNMYLPKVINLSKIFRAVICKTTSVLLSRRTRIKCLSHIKVHVLHTDLNITFSILAWLSSWDTYICPRQSYRLMWV
jgi:hypothetical protein